jgi:hypothetical protein
MCYNYANKYLIEFVIFYSFEEIFGTSKSIMIRAPSGVQGGL